MKFLLLEEVDSTNSYVSRHAGELDDMTMVIAESQTAGRGQRGNSWESAPGCNLTFTLLARDLAVLPAEQFSISEAVALAVADFLGECGIDAKVKWPNDIYVGDKKIAGILIEHALMGSRIEHTRIGVGLNVNQKGFVSDAPNPVSMTTLTGKRYDISRVAAKVGMQIEKRLGTIAKEEGRRSLHKEFKEALWRGIGEHPFRERGSQQMFVGKIVDVDPKGPIKIENITTGITKDYAFKEIEFLL